MERWPSFLGGAVLTLELAFLATVLGATLGTLAAVGRGTRHRLISGACKAYVEAIRNTPLLVQIFLVYFGLASIGLKFSAFTRGGGRADHQCRRLHHRDHARRLRGHSARARSRRPKGSALSRFQVYWHVILLPAIERVYPALTSQFVLLMLASSVCSQISAEELTAVANYIQSDTYRAFETYIIVAVLYVVLSLRHARRLLGSRPAAVPAPAPARHAVVR